MASRDTVLAARDRIAPETGGKLDMLYHNSGHRNLAMAIDPDAHRAASIAAHDAPPFEPTVTAVTAAARGTIAFSGSGCGATKAALEVHPRTLRIEVEPLGVRVAYVMAAGVRAGMAARRRDAPQGSLYKAVGGKISEAWEDREENGVSPAEYSALVVERVSKPNPPEVVWQGCGWWKVWLVELLNLQWLYPRVLAPQFGLDKALL